MGKNVDGLGRRALFYFVTFLFIVKILFAFLAVVHIYLKRTGKDDTKMDEFVSFWKERLEFVFIIGVSGLIINKTDFICFLLQLIFVAQ
jgi:hypothetical protein